MSDLEKRLERIENQLKFFAESYTILHNTLNMKSPSIRFEQEKVFKEFLSASLNSIVKTLNEKFNRNEEHINGALKFIGKRLDSLEKEHTKKINLKFTVDGHEYDKKIKVDESGMTEERAIDLILEGLSSEEKLLMVHHYGLNGEKPKTFNAISKILLMDRQRCSYVEKKALVKCRNHRLQNHFEYISNLKFKKAVLGK